MRETLLLLLTLLPYPVRTAVPEAPAGPPRVLSWVPPAYPQDRLWQATVEVLVTVDRKGAVVEASAVGSEAPELSQVCEAAARQWRFAPGSLPVRSASLTFDFAIDRRPEASWVRPAESIDPYHVRVWGQVDSPCARGGANAILTSPPPGVVSWIAPQYTEVARKARLQGTVKTLAEVDSKGRVVRACSLQKLPYGLNKASEEALRKWRFAADSGPVRWVEIEVDFGVNDTEETNRPADLVTPYHLRVWADPPQIDPVIY